MNEVVIRVENVSKEYHLGTIGYGTLRQDLQSIWAKIRKKEDPNAKIDILSLGKRKVINNRFCALKNISFDVERGEIVGIIGRNGTGKSTLLKVLSRLTAPTKGCIKIKGNVASLLEVGTGFHPELTGRENIFLNGAILGMRKNEIEYNLNDIIKFADIDKFLDTPVKRYSSGMYVRLAFAVAAHLNPDILLVDEVLAVGDAGFQKKCLGKMKQVGESEKTVLFVSHSMGAITSICRRAILLENGQIIRDGDVKEVTQAYFSNFQSDIGEIVWSDINTAPGTDTVRLHSVRILQEGCDGATSDVDIVKDIIVEISYWNLHDGSMLSSALTLKDALGSYVLATNTIKNISLTDDTWEDIPRPIGLFISQCLIPKGLLNNITYGITISIVKNKTQSQIYMEDVLQFTVHESGQMKTNQSADFVGVVRPRLSWNTKHVSGV